MLVILGRHRARTGREPGQARSYAFWLKPAYYVITDGDHLAVWNYQGGAVLDLRVCEIRRGQLRAQFSSLNAILNPEAALAKRQQMIGRLAGSQPARGRGLTRSSREGRHNELVRATKRKHPLRRRIVAPPPGVDLAAVAERTSYVGSTEHKKFPSFAGPFNPRADASKCDPKLADREELTRWLREAISIGNTGELWEGDFPRYVWCQHGGVIYEGRLSNPGLGEYKGYPLEADEHVEGLK
ncbi:hypothetical protein [Trebonia sp.]|uniref:hypothetical protein n=1 Tax=Trebonia sp. TaxID=2767075 RepID=UPI00261E3943|nr:hypothetical protein [Trebonia sp.]